MTMVRSALPWPAAHAEWLGRHDQRASTMEARSIVARSGEPQHQAQAPEKHRANAERSANSLVRSSEPPGHEVGRSKRGADDDDPNTNMGDQAECRSVTKNNASASR